MTDREADTNKTKLCICPSPEGCTNDNLEGCAHCASLDPYDPCPNAKGEFA